MTAGTNPLARAAAVLEQLTGGRAIVVLDDEPQALLVMDMRRTPPELVVSMLDRDGDTAAVTLTPEGVTRVRNALTGWLEGQA